jgi:hypothetical protein
MVPQGEVQGSVYEFSPIQKRRFDERNRRLKRQNDPALAVLQVGCSAHRLWRNDCHVSYYAAHRFLLFTRASKPALS